MATGSNPSWNESSMGSEGLPKSIRFLMHQGARRSQSQRSLTSYRQMMDPNKLYREVHYYIHKKRLHG